MAWRTIFQFHAVCHLDMLAGITYTEFSDQDESEPGCPRLKSTYAITAHFHFAKHFTSGRLRPLALKRAAAGANAGVPPGGK